MNESSLPPSSNPSGANKVIPIAAIEAVPEGEDHPEYVSLYAARKKIFARSVKGVFHSWRWAMVWLTQLIFYGLPWLQWGQRQAVLFDIEARRFYIFGLVFYPQDLIYLTALLIISAMSLFLFTTIAGRLWCGYTCPQTVYTEIFMWIEYKTQGDRSARMRLAKQSWNFEKIWRAGLKHLLWIVVALWTGYTFVGYFTPIRVLWAEIWTSTLGAWETFWILFYALATYGNAGWLREQVCLYMCPYARFQSAMFDKDTMIVTYDKQRGEPRGARSKKVDYKAQNKGDCIDCSLCVQVCPTGIDIRKGLQYECIGCGACIDACDEVMGKMNYPKGLIRYTTENALEKKWSRAQIFKRVLRPRVLIYITILLFVVTAMVVGMVQRKSFKVDVVRDRGVMARIVGAGNIENVYRIQIINTTEANQIFQISVQGLPGLKVNTQTQVQVSAAQTLWVPVGLKLPHGAAKAGVHEIEIVVRNEALLHEVKEETTFIVPR